MNRRAFLGTVTGGLLAAPLAAEAQPARKVWRIGMLRSESTEAAPLFRAFDDGLRTLGYTIGRDLLIAQRSTDGSPEQDATGYADLARLNVDLFVVTADRTAVAARKVAPHTPIVMVAAEDPVGAGLAEALAHPGGNVTGLTILVSPEINGKNLEVLREALPRGARIALSSSTLHLAAIVRVFRLQTPQPMRWASNLSQWRSASRRIWSRRSCE